MSCPAESTKDATAFETVLCLRDHQGETPIFCFYPAGGLSWSYSGLIAHIADPNRGVFAIQSPLLRGKDKSLDSLNAAAIHAVQDIISTAKQYHIDLAQGIDLVGWPVGGLLAHEATGILHEHVGKVRNLCLLDAYPAACWKDLELPDEQQQLEGILTMAGLSCTDAQHNLDRDSVIAALRQSHGPFAQLSSTVISRIMDAVTQHVALMKGHETTALDHTAHLFVAAKEPSHKELGIHPKFWKPYLRDLHVYETPVDHPGMMSPSALREVARVLNT